MRGIIGNEAHYHLSPGEVGETEGEVVGEEREVAGKRLKRVSPRPPRSCMVGIVMNIVMHALPVWQTGHDN